jgi:hypothetical protein
MTLDTTEIPDDKSELRPVELVAIRMIAAVQDIAEVVDEEVVDV